MWLSQVCDGVLDCLGGEDEADALNCDVEATCAAGFFQCEGGECLPGSLRCDHTADCARADDEENCSKCATLDQAQLTLSQRDSSGAVVAA